MYKKRRRKKSLIPITKEVGKLNIQLFGAIVNPGNTRYSCANLNFFEVAKRRFNPLSKLFLRESTIKRYFPNV